MKPHAQRKSLDRYRLWKQKQTDIGCVFARYMAAKPTEFGQHAEVVTGCDPTAVASAIATRITDFVGDPQIVAAALVFPEVTDLGTLVKVALSLSTLPHWKVTRAILQDTPIGDVVAFNVVRHIPTKGGTCPSESLVLGPFPEFPNTRKAPITALEIFVGAPPAHQHDGNPTKKAHLADVPMQFPAATVFKNMWSNSIDGRLRSLGGVEDQRAKAKVSFAIPKALAVSMGCVP